MSHKTTYQAVKDTLARVDAAIRDAVGRKCAACGTALERKHWPGGVESTGAFLRRSTCGPRCAGARRHTSALANRLARVPQLKPLCVTPGCAGVLHARGLCWRHYLRVYRAERREEAAGAA